MSAITPTSICQVRAWCSDGEQAAVNTFYYRFTSVTPGVTTQSVADAIENILAPLYKALICNSATWNGLQVRDIANLPQEVYTLSFTHAGAGTGGAVGLPRQACGLISWGSNLAGPSNRGRTYVPFPTATEDQTNGIPTAAYISLLLALTAGLISPLIISAGGGSVTTKMVLKKKPGLSTVDIVNTVQRNRWATQKRRGSYGRPNISPV